MIIDGRKIADDTLLNLLNRVAHLKKQGVTPTMAVILVGDDPGSESYVRQKQKMADSIHAQVKVIRYPQTVSQAIINKTIEQYNNDSHIHGIILQRPLPKHLQNPKLLNSINPNKDVDGFVPNSLFKVPVAMAVEKILKQIYKLQMIRRRKSFGGQANDTSMQQRSNGTIKQFVQWMQTQKIVVIGRGETAGTPIAKHFIKNRCTISIIHSKTPNDEKVQLLKKADIIISCVGKNQVITAQSIKKGVILISVGIWRDDAGKLHGDYEEDEIKDIASFYTPTPGGVGPVNVASLMENLISAVSSPL